LASRFASSKSLFQNARRLARRPSRLTFGIAAASAATVAGVTASLSLGAAPAVGAVGQTVSLAVPDHAGAVGELGIAAHAMTIGAPAQIGAGNFETAAGPALTSSQPAPHAAAANLPAIVQAPSGPRRQSGGQQPARSSHQATGRSQSARHPGPAGHAAGSRHQAAPARHQAPAQHQAAARHQAPAQHQAPARDHAAPLHPAARNQAPRHAPRPRRAAPATPARPWEIYDSVTPSAIPAGHEVATYADGPFAVSPGQVAGRNVMWIDTNGTDYRANALDVEPGDATPSIAASWAWHKLSSDPRTKAVIYTMQSEWPAVQAAVGTLPHWMQAHVRWWIADPTGYPHLVPGSDATQWYWGSSYDITTANPGF
jgi:hypothetical protein